MVMVLLEHPPFRNVLVVHLRVPCSACADGGRLSALVAYHALANVCTHAARLSLLPDVRTGTLLGEAILPPPSTMRGAPGDTDDGPCDAEVVAELFRLTGTGLLIVLG